MATTKKPKEPATGKTKPVVRQCAEVYLERSSELTLKLVVRCVKAGGWNWSVWNPRSELRLAEDAGRSETESDAKLAAHRAAVKLMRREAERLDSEVDFVEESQPEWD